MSTDENIQRLKAVFSKLRRYNLIGYPTSLWRYLMRRMRKPPETKDNKSARIYPIVRFGWEFSDHLRTVTHSMFNEGFAERLSQQIQNYETRMQRQLKSLAKLDGALLILIATKSQDISILGFPIIALSFATEAFMLTSAFAFFFWAMSFATSQGYRTILTSWCLNVDEADPEYLKASYANEELVLKILRAGTTFYTGVRSDFWMPRSPFKTIAKLSLVGILAVLLLVFLLHSAIQTVAGIYVYETQNLGAILSYSILTICFILHAYACAILVFCFKSFSFDRVEAPFKT